MVAARNAFRHVERGFQTSLFHGRRTGHRLHFDGSQSRDLRRWVLLASVGMVAAGLFFAWTHYADSLSAQAVYPYQELRLSQIQTLSIGISAICVFASISEPGSKLAGVFSTRLWALYP